MNPRASERSSTASTGQRTAAVALGCAIGAVLGIAAGPARAFDIATGNPDLTVRWDNTLRYNVAMRMQSVDPRIALAAPGPAYTFDESDYLFAKKHDIISNRLDLLSELDLRFMNRFGGRLSGAAWYDNAYDGKTPQQVSASDLPVGAAAVSAGGTSNSTGRFSSYTKRYYAGPSGELLDAYVYGNFDIDDKPLNLRAGRHVVIWGEGLFGSAHSIAYAQTPSDGRKATANPGASAKETALPIGQVSGTFQPMDKVTVLAQYLYEWLPTRIPEGGTYFAGADSIEYGPTDHRRSREAGRAGDIGLGVRVTPDWLDGTVGFYVRRFDDKGSWAAQPLTGAGDPDIFATKSVYARGVRLYGVSLSKNVFGLSVGSDISYRENAALNSVPTASAGPNGRYEGAIGSTWHWVLNAVKTFGTSPLFDSAALSGEFAYSHLEKVSKNANLFKATGNNAFCNNGLADGSPKIRGCADKDFYSLALSFSPSWTQVFPSVDLSLPIFVSRNIKGNAPTNGGGSEGFTTFKLGVSATAYARYLFDLAYTGYDQKLGPTGTPGVVGPAGYGRLLGAPYKDKGWLSFTFQTTF
jgi:hypothetical protein